MAILLVNAVIIIYFAINPHFCFLSDICASNDFYNLCLVSVLNISIQQAEYVINMQSLHSRFYFIQQLLDSKQFLVILILQKVCVASIHKDEEMGLTALGCWET